MVIGERIDPENLKKKEKKEWNSFLGCIIHSGLIIYIIGPTRTYLELEKKYGFGYTLKVGD